MHIVLEYSSKSNVDIICYYNVFECRIKICCQISGWQFYRVEDNTKKGSSQLLSLMVILSWDPSTESWHVVKIADSPKTKLKAHTSLLSVHRDDHYEIVHLLFQNILKYLFIFCKH